MTPAEQHIKLSSEFIAYLKDKLNYPEDALIPEYLLSPSNEQRRSFFVDLAIADSRDSDLLAIVEFKIKDDARMRNSALSQVSKYLAVYGRMIPTYLVTIADSNDSKFQVYILDESKSWQEISLSEFPNFNVLSGSIKTQRKVEVRKEKQKTFDNFTLICYTLAGLLFLLFFLNLFKVINLRAEDLGVLGAAIALAVIPNAAKLNFLGVEFERFTPTIEKNALKDEERTNS